MKIETKFNIGDKVWLMWGNKAIQREIRSLYIQIDSEEQYEAYNLSVQEEDDNVLNDCLFELDEIFRTKQELLDSL